MVHPLTDLSSGDDPEFMELADGSEYLVFPASIISSDAPEWAIRCDAITLDAGTDRTGAYGYECHELYNKGTNQPYGWVYDLGAGYVWVDRNSARPEPLTSDKRGKV